MRRLRTSAWRPAVATLAEVHPELAGRRVHDLRRSAASLAVSAGASIKAVNKTLGHKHVEHPGPVLPPLRR